MGSWCLFSALELLWLWLVGRGVRVWASSQKSRAINCKPETLTRSSTTERKAVHPKRRSEQRFLFEKSSEGVRENVQLGGGGGWRADI